jgi:hypothetical protein
MMVMAEDQPRLGGNGIDESYGGSFPIGINNIDLGLLFSLNCALKWFRRCRTPHRPVTVVFW